MSEQQYFSDLFITSAVITGPIVDNILFGPCVNNEYSNLYMKSYDKKDIQFDNDFDIEERKEEYSDEELSCIYNNSKIQAEEDIYYDCSRQIYLERESYWQQMYLEELEYNKFLEEEEEKEIKIDYAISKNK